MVLRQAGAVAAQRVLVIDSYDSFVYNLVQYLGELGADPIVVRNDQLTVDEALAARTRCRAAVARARADPRMPASSVPSFRRSPNAACRCSVCASVIKRSVTCTAGRSCTRRGSCTARHHRSNITVSASSTTCPSPLTATRYHSLVIDPATMPACLEVTATSGDVVMGIRHRELPVQGVQFHPESILTGCGHDLLRNFLYDPR